MARGPVWKPVLYPSPIPFGQYYEINKNGDVRRIGASKVLKSRLDRVTLSVGGAASVLPVAMLVAHTFLPPPRSEAYCHLAHKNGNIHDPSAANLRWSKQRPPRMRVLDSLTELRNELMSELDSRIGALRTELMGVFEASAKPAGRRRRARSTG